MRESKQKQKDRFTSFFMLSVLEAKIFQYTLRAVGFFYAKRERNHSEQPFVLLK